MTLPTRIAEDGTRLPPSGIDPYSLPWVQGAAATVPGRVRRAHSERQADLREKLSVLKAKRPARLEGDVTPAWGPRRRPRELRVLDQTPLPADGQTIWS